MATPSPPASPSSAEREIKLMIPAPAWDGVVAALRTAPCRESALHAAYHDTPDRALAEAGLALRVRREAGHWVQTLKAGGQGLFERLEDNLPLGRGSMDRRPQPPPADLSRHQRPEVRALLRHALDLAPSDRLPAVHPVFEVRVTRLSREVMEGGSRIEIAVDHGTLEAGGRSREVREVEFELLEGSFQDALRLARKWRERHGLWISLDSKAARGHRLAAGGWHAEAQGHVEPRYGDTPSMGELTGAIVHACLYQVIANADALASGSEDAEHVHQLRVGLRRLRTALRELPLLAVEAAKFEAVITKAFRTLGVRRDRTHVLAQLLPLIERKTGMPLALPEGFVGEEPAAETACDPSFQDALLALLAHAEELPSRGGGHVRRHLRRQLDKLLAQVLEDGRRLRKLDEAQQHRVRKRIKRLRYLTDSVAALFPPHRVRKFIDAIKPVQDTLGQYNDTLIALALLAELSVANPTVVRVQPELERQRRRQVADGQDGLRRLARVRPFWPK